MKNFLEYLKNFEPAVWKSIVGALVALAIIWGLDISVLGEQLTQSIDVIAYLIPAVITVLTGFWIRRSVTAPGNSAVVLDKDGEPVAGPALDAPDGTPVNVYAFPEEHEPKHMVE